MFLFVSLPVSLLPSVAHPPRCPGPPTFGALGGPQTVAISASVLETSHNDFHLEPVHKHSQMHRDTLWGLRQAACMLRLQSLSLVSLISFLIEICLFVCELLQRCLFGCPFYEIQQSPWSHTGRCANLVCVWQNSRIKLKPFYRKPLSFPAVVRPAARLPPRRSALQKGCVTLCCA